jgi:hypothetical protein
MHLLKWLVQMDKVALTNQKLPQSAVAAVAVTKEIHRLELDALAVLVAAAVNLQLVAAVAVQQRKREQVLQHFTATLAEIHRIIYHHFQVAAEVGLREQVAIQHLQLRLVRAARLVTLILLLLTQCPLA